LATQTAEYDIERFAQREAQDPNHKARTSAATTGYFRGKIIVTCA